MSENFLFLLTMLSLLLSLACLRFQASLIVICLAYVGVGWLLVNFEPGVNYGLTLNYFG